MAVLKASRRPLLTLGADDDSLRKAGNKSRLRQLRKQGDVVFRRVTDPSEFGPLLEQVVRFHDKRQLMSHGSTPFANDPQKQAFHLALMNTKGLLHVTVLEVGGVVVSAHLNLIRKAEVQLCLIAHNPAWERFSPGKLHIRFLGKMLFDEGYERIDLTPGGEEYKERFANDADTVHTLTVFPSLLQRTVGAGMTAVEDCARSLLTRWNIKPTRVVSLTKKARHVLDPATLAIRKVE